MKRLVISIGGLLAVIYISAMPSATQRTPTNGSQHSRAKAAPKTPGELLKQNKKLSDKLSALLRHQNPPVTDIQAASQGFTNLGELFAAVHISQNLGIPFDQLKKTRAQTSGILGNAIHTLKPNADTKAELWKAAEQAVDDLEESYWVIAQSFSPSMRAV
jgi:ABC-type transporter Mla subunit MlaD